MHAVADPSVVYIRWGLFLGFKSVAWKLRELLAEMHFHVTGSDTSLKLKG